MKFDLRFRLAAEFLGAAFLVAAVVGLGRMGQDEPGGGRPGASVLRGLRSRFTSRQGHAT
jgi:hypothetical protein